MASPLWKRVMETEIVTETVFTTITHSGFGPAPAAPTTTSTSVTEEQTSVTSKPIEEPSSIPSSTPVDSPALPVVSEIAQTPAETIELPTEIPEMPTENNQASIETSQAPVETTEPIQAAAGPTVAPVETTRAETKTTSAETTPDENTPVAQTTSESPAPTDSGSNTGSDPIIAAGLSHHNVHRANHSAPDLLWDEDLASYAAITAKTCNFAHDTETGGGGYGQNIAMWASSNDVRSLGADVFLGRSITEMWYNGEINLYPANAYGGEPDMSNFSAWGHYSQLIWVGTTHVGCAVQFCEPGTMVDGMSSYYSVCNYSPPGNMGGGYGDNVLPPQGQATFHSE